MTMGRWVSGIVIIAMATVWGLYALLGSCNEIAASIQLLCWVLIMRDFDFWKK
jgi:hypothetical protein